MLEKIKQHQRLKADLLTFYIEKRLNKSLSTYYSQLIGSVEALESYDERNVLKSLIKKDDNQAKFKGN